MTQNYEYGLVNCIQPIYLYSDWIQLVQFVEIWRHLGSNHFVAYVTHLTPLIDDMLSVYQNELNMITKVVWPTLPNSSSVDPNAHVYRSVRDGSCY